jgi:hypothetical protein
MLNRTDGTVVGENGHIASTRDGGNTWMINQGQSFTDDFYSVKFTSDNEAIAFGRNGILAKSIDKGLTWVGVSSRTTNDIHAFDYVQNFKGYAAGSEVTLLESKNGSNWYSVLPKPCINCMSVGYYSLNSNNSQNNSKGLNTTNTPDKYSLLQNYPNPFNPVTTIKYQIPVSGMVTLKIYDISGKEVASLVNETKSAGSYSIQWSANNFSSGTYFYKIEANGYTETKKMLLVK